MTELEAYKWITRDGRVIRIKDLENDHLENIVNWLRKRGYVHSSTFFSCLAYVCNSKTPEGAAYSAAVELDGMMFNDLFDSIFEEWNERGGRAY